MCSHLYFIIDLYNEYAPFYSTVGFHVFSSVLYNNIMSMHHNYALHNCNTLMLHIIIIIGFAYRICTLWVTDVTIMHTCLCMSLSIHIVSRCLMCP